MKDKSHVPVTLEHTLNHHFHSPAELFCISVKKLPKLSQTTVAGADVHFAMKEWKMKNTKLFAVSSFYPLPNEDISKGGWWGVLPECLEELRGGGKCKGIIKYPYSKAS